ncbi:glycylpeptide N-tetradecanoyltransferase [Metarhizium robertsii ARSEF 23]|uniref:Glycylpeptide N-tetradecanoyltransferase n=1 Tax=Metarhizium robertsii (strain ARSEF 23 / ATCC MYA-3075) TaxID=655844 RepID=A0A0B2XGL5_METRA|nr:glycylpeptide N-tetradecanoyltransferase [Metarhizium robertsii ARSEF 23]KHO11066.1 glycylpeptide N-tetradecanoyltransferase [Metarhizium robertsii ARSEF 23]
MDQWWAGRRMFLVVDFISGQPISATRGFALISFWPLAPPGWPATVLYLRRSCLRPPCQTGGGAELPADWQRPADVSQSGRHTWGHGWSAISPALAFRAPPPSSHHPASSLASDTNKAAGCGPPEVPPKMDAQSPPGFPVPPSPPILDWELWVARGAQLDIAVSWPSLLLLFVLSPHLQSLSPFAKLLMPGY